MVVWLIFAGRETRQVVVADKEAGKGSGANVGGIFGP